MMPGEDRVRSPYTGWTRRHWEAVADRLLAGVEPYRSPGMARVDLPGPASRSGRISDGLEGFARTFLLAGFRIAGENGADPGNLLERYARGLAAGTDPGSGEAWPRPDELGQAKVEAASVALILQLTRPWLWDRLDDPVRQRVADWLGTVVGQPYPPINWVWFRIVTESFLREVGGRWSVADIEADLAVHAGMRRDGGWLSDGPDRAYDHYVGWALHLYPLLWTHLFDVTGTLCPRRLRDTWAADLAGYLADATCLVGADGSPLMQGRSLTYRFAAAAPFWVGALTGTGGQPPGLVRRAASGMLRHFADAGALDGGVLRLGWHAEWPPIRQSYSGPGSPYWASKGMLGLALPADHPVWTDVEAPLPVETGDVSRAVVSPGWLVSARRADGFAVVLNHGTDHARPGDTGTDAPLYARLGYSTATFPPLDPAGADDPVDNAVVLLDRAGRATHRAGFETLYVRALPGGVSLAASGGPVRWVDASADGSADHGSGRAGTVVSAGWITVASVLRDGLETRLVRLDAPAAEAATLRLGGWPLAAGDPPATTVATAEPGALVRAGSLRSLVRGVAGFATAGVATYRDASPLGRHGATPWAACPAVPGIVLAAVLLDRPGRRPEPPVPEVHADRVELRWPDGVRAAVELPCLTSVVPGEALARSRSPRTRSSRRAGR